MAASLTPPTWRQMTPADLPGVLYVMQTIHSPLPERDLIFLERMSLFPQGCLVLTSPSNNQPPNSTSTIHGYAVSHPIPKRTPPKLDTLLGSIPREVDSTTQFYIHDVAILPEWRGRGLAGEVIRRLLGVAEGGGYETCCLISVYGTGQFWGRFGFGRVEGELKELEEMVKVYGGDAVFLERRN